MYDFAYRRPKTLDEALGLLSGDEFARPLSGGQTLMPVLRARLAGPSQLVDLSQLAALKGIAIEGDRLVIKAGECHADVAASPVVQAALPALAGLAGGIGDIQVRHRGTIGGSVANNDPAACYPSSLLALDAEIITSRRRIAATDFFTGMFATALEADEIVVGVSFPRCADAHYEKFKNPASRFALIGVFAAKLGGTFRIAITGGGNGVFRWHEAEAHLSGGGSLDTLASVPLAADNFTGDLHGSSDYRRELAYVVVRRAVMRLQA